MLTKTRAIVLHHIKYGESSIIVTLYTEKLGRVSCIVNGVRSNKPKFPMTFFQPLTLLETELYFKPNREIHRLKDISSPFHYVSIPFGIAKNTIALFLAEILYHTLHEQEGNTELFDFLYHVFQLLDAREDDISNFHIRFLLHYARYLGFSLVNMGSVQKTGYSSDLRVFRDLPDEAASALEQMMKASLAEPDRLKLTHANRSLLLDSLLRYYREHLEGMGRIRSQEVLKEIFRG